MGCFVGCLALLFPRFALFLIWLTSGYLDRAYETNLWPFLGFLFMPFTTLTYAFAVNANGSVTGIYLILVVIAALVDLGMGGGSANEGRRRWS